jgi:hypothetical protein
MLVGYEVDPATKAPSFFLTCLQMNMAAFFFGVDGELEVKKIDLIFSKAIECK